MSNDEEIRLSCEKIGLVYNAIINCADEMYIKKLLQTEGDINYKTSGDSHRVPNLLHTALDRQCEYFNLLLEYGADFTYQDKEDGTVVHSASNDEDWMFCGRLNLNSVFAAYIKFNNPSNPCDKNGISHFHVACMVNNAVAIEFFLKNKVDVNQAVNADSPRFASYTPLHLALKHTCPDAVEILLKHGADLNLKTATGLSPLHLIIIRKMDIFYMKDQNFEKMLNIFAKFLMNNDVNHDINATDEYGFCKFHVACVVQDHALIESGLERIKNINQPVNLESPVCPGYTALHFAAFSKIEVFKLLLRKGADIEAKNARGETPFDLCLQNYTAEDIHSILSAKKEWKSIILSDNKTKLIDVMKNVDELVSFLYSTKSILTSIVPFDSPLWPGYTLLHLAVVITGERPIGKHTYCQPNDEVVRICLKREVDVTTRDANGSTALHLSFYMKKYYAMKYILDHHHKSDNPTDKDNLSHFHIACAVDHLKAVKHFLSVGVDVNRPVFSTFQAFRGITASRYFICPGSTALHISVANGNVELTDILLKHGADVNAPDANGFTPVHRLLSSKSYACSTSQKLFSTANLKNIATSCGLNYLHVACYLGNIDAVDKLLRLRADLNAPLTYKCDERITADECKTIHSDLDPYGDPQDPLGFLSRYDGYTPLRFACERHYKTVLFLIERCPNALGKGHSQTQMLNSLLRRIDDREIYFKVISKNEIIKKHLEVEYGITELHIVCRIAEVNLVEHLIKDGANINAQVKFFCQIWQGYTPLHCAVERACKENFRENDLMDSLEKIIQILTTYGADVLLADKNNNTPFELWCLGENSNEIESTFWRIVAFFPILFQGITNFSAIMNKRGVFLFRIACMTMNVAIVETFLKNGIDVNQAMSYFTKFHPGSTPLHLVIKSYRSLYRYRYMIQTYMKFHLNNEAFLELVNMLLKNGAEVNATDALSNTLLHEAVELSDGVRSIIMQKLISNGADVHAVNAYYDTPFSSLLKCGNATWEEIDLFLNAGCNFNSYHPSTQKGYMAIFLQEIKSSNVKMEYQFLRQIINNPRIIEIDDLGRSALHNVVSIESYKKIVCMRYNGVTNGLMVLGIIVTLLFFAPCLIGRRIVREVKSHKKEKALEAKRKFYPTMFQQLLMNGCDVDHQDNEGKTALHLAVAFENDVAVSELLKNGADINIIDNDKKTAFACLCDSEYDAYDDDINARRCSYPLESIFVDYFCKLEFCNQYVSEQNKQSLIKALKILNVTSGKVSDCFYKEMKKSKTLKIGGTSISLYEFLTNEDMETFYLNMTVEERQGFDQLPRQFDKYNFCEIDCLVNLKYKKTIERKKLFELARTSLNVLANYQLPGLISQFIINFLTNEDLKRLIASVT